MFIKLNGKIRKGSSKMATPICSFCLAANRKMIFIDNMELRRIFLKLISIEAVIEPNLSLLEFSLPESMCYVCYWQLQRCRRFVHMAHRSNNILQDIASIGLEVTKETLVLLNIKTIQNLTIQTKIASTDHDTDEIIKHVAVKEESIVENHDDDIFPMENNHDYIPRHELNDVAKTEDTSFDDDDDTKPLIDEGKSYVYCEIKTTTPEKVKKKHKCKACNQKYRKSDIEKHKCVKSKKKTAKNTKLPENITKKVKRKIEPEDLTCELCNRTFSDKYVLKKHLKIHSGEKPYVCNKCNRAFLLPSYLKDHILRTHSENKEYACSECSKTFSVKNTLLKHIRRLHSGKTHTCDRCARAFNNNSDLKSHMVVHSNERPHICPTCGKAFKRKNQLNEHFKLHSDQKAKKTELHECPHCSKKYTLRASLFNHIKIHTGMLYTCDRCAVSCRDRSTLKIHMLIHSDARPHSCPTCGRGFKRKGQLNEHAKVHSGARPHACDQCDKTFTQKGSLNFHKRVHTGQRPFVCEVCGKTFDSKYNMAKHLRIHTGERPYHCHSCSLRFTHASSLHDHARKYHGGEKLSCDECYKTFIHKSTLKKHMKTHAREK